MYGEVTKCGVMPIMVTVMTIIITTVIITTLIITIIATIIITIIATAIVSTTRSSGFDPAIKGTTDQPFVSLVIIVPVPVLLVPDQSL